MAMQTYERLECELADWLKLERDGMVACASGSAALHLGIEALEMPLGSRVLVPDYTMVSCARAVELAGHVPAFVDCDSYKLLLGTESLGCAGVTPYHALMAVHIYGRRDDMDWLHSVTGMHHYVIEDMAECHGVPPSCETDVACWSFYQNKLVHGEEGGAVWFKDRAMAAVARELRCVGMGPVQNYAHRPRGMNYRMANCCAHLISESLLDVFNETQRRRRLEEMYDKFCPAEWRMPDRTSPWVYDVRVPGMTRPQQEAVVRALNQTGVAARMGFLPMHLQEGYLKYGVAGYNFVDDSGPLKTPTNSARAADEVFTLPLTSNLWGPAPDPLHMQQIFSVIAATANASP